MLIVKRTADPLFKTDSASRESAGKRIFRSVVTRRPSVCEEVEEIYRLLSTLPVRDIGHTLKVLARELTARQLACVGVTDRREAESLETFLQLKDISADDYHFETREDGCHLFLRLVAAR
jgi:hypothetical protein